MEFKVAERIRSLKPYQFAELNRIKAELKAQGKDLIDLSIGDPDLSTPDEVIEVMQEMIWDSKTHRYPPYEGLFTLRERISEWYKSRFNVELDPEKEVLVLIGSKEGLHNFSQAFVNPGDKVLVPSPAYPVYSSSTRIFGGEEVELPLREEGKFLPDLSELEKKVGDAKILWLCYPNNPTAAVIEKEHLQKIVDSAKKKGCIVCYDNAYSEITFDGYVAPSLLEMSGGKDVGIEFHSFSKTFNMTGWRLGFAVGNASLISGLRNLKTNIDSGQFTAIQYAGIEALDNLIKYPNYIQSGLEIYSERRDVFVDGVNSDGLHAEKSKGTFYVWVKVPQSYTSQKFATKLLEEASVVVTPGNNFGTYGEGYIRVALTEKKERIKEAVERIAKVL